MIAIVIVAFLAGLAVGFAWGEVRGYRWGRESWTWTLDEWPEQLDIDPPATPPKFVYTPKSDDNR